MLKGNLLLCGDFNMVLNDVLDSSSVSRRRRPTLGSLCLEEKLFNPWRCLRTTERDYTHYSMVHSYSRIDFFLTHVYTLQTIGKADIHNITWSDHAPVTIEVVDTSTVSHKPLWRNNTFLLLQPELRDEIEGKIQEYFALGDCSPTTVWCAHKAVIRGTLIQIASREKKKNEKTLQKSIADLEAQHKIPNSSSSLVLNRLNSCHEELRQELRAEYDMYFKRLKLSYYAQNNRAGKLLSSQLKKRQARSNLTQIKHHQTNATLCESHS